MEIVSSEEAPSWEKGNACRSPVNESSNVNEAIVLCTVSLPKFATSKYGTLRGIQSVTEEIECASNRNKDSKA
jgi:hypothetical protein